MGRAQPPIRARHAGFVEEVSTDGFAEATVEPGQLIRVTESGVEGVDSSMLGGSGDFERLFLSSGDSTPIMSSSSETTYDTSSHTIDAGALVVGDEIRTTVYGRYISPGFSNGKLTIRFKAGSVILATLGVLNAADGATKYFAFDIRTEVRAIGASGQLVTTVPVRTFANGHLKSTNRVIATVDTTKSIALGITAQWEVGLGTNITDLSSVSYSRVKGPTP